MAATKILFSNGETETFQHETRDSLSLQVAQYSRTHGHCTITQMRELEEDDADKQDQG